MIYQINVKIIKN